jgi:hypothetical protein
MVSSLLPHSAADLVCWRSSVMRGSRPCQYASAGPFPAFAAACCAQQWASPHQRQDGTDERLPENRTTTFEGCAYIRRHRPQNRGRGWARLDGDKPAFRVNMGGGERFRKNMLNLDII